MEKLMSLANRYAKMETKELVTIISLDKEQYTPEAINAAKAELRKRGETKETLVPLLTEAREEKKAIQEKPLGQQERLFFTLLFTLLPGISFLCHARFTEISWKRRRLEGSLCMYRGLFVYFGITSMVAIIDILRHVEKITTNVLVGFFSLEGAIFAALIFAHRKTKKKLAEMLE